MMARKQLLRDFLKENQEPFDLKSYIAEKRSQFKNNSLQVRKRSPIVPKIPAKRGFVCKHACFLTFQNSPDVRKSPFIDFQSSAAMSPCKSPNRGALFLHIPTRAASLHVESEMMIHKQKQSKPKVQSINVGFGLLGSFLKRLKDRSKNKKRSIGGNELNVSRKNEENIKENSLGLSCADRTVSNEDQKTSTSSCCSECSGEINGDFHLEENRFCSSPFRFSLRISPSSSGHCTPEFCSPAASPSRHVEQEKENNETQNPDNVKGGGGGEEEEEEKEQCSPVSVLDPPFNDDGHESADAEEDDYDLECGYANVQRAKQQLLCRLRRFEELAELDPMELERKLIEGSDDEDVKETNEEPLSPSADTFVTEVFNQSSLHDHTKRISADMKRLVADLIVEEKCDVLISGSREVVLGRICNRLDSWKEVEFNTIDMMVDLDFKREFDGWKKFGEQEEEMVAEIEVKIFGLLVEELSEELLCMDLQHQEPNMNPA